MSCSKPSNFVLLVQGPRKCSRIASHYKEKPIPSLKQILQASKNTPRFLPLLFHFSSCPIFFFPPTSTTKQDHGLLGFLSCLYSPFKQLQAGFLGQRKRGGEGRTSLKRRQRRARARRRDRDMRGGGRLRGFWGILYALTSSLVFFWLLSEEILYTAGTSTIITGTSSIGSFEHSNYRGRESSPSHPDLDLNYMSKRRVPNGPDPIHNRRAGKSRRPPGRA